MRPRVLVTRPAEQGPALVAALEARGMAADHVPTVAIQPAEPARLAAAVGAEPWDWIILTSVNGVAPFAAAAAVRPLDPRTRIAAVGAPTAEALAAAGLRVDHVPDRFLTVAIADGLGDLAGARVLLARADAATPDLRDALEARGANVRDVVAYRTVEGPASSTPALRAALDGAPAAVTFTSGSTVRGLLALLDGDRARLAAAQRVPAACIGPVTAAEAVRLGWRPIVVASTHTAIGLADGLAAHLALEVTA